MIVTVLVMVTVKRERPERREHHGNVFPTLKKLGPHLQARTPSHVMSTEPDAPPSDDDATREEQDNDTTPDDDAERVHALCSSGETMSFQAEKRLENFFDGPCLS